eukprot:5787905-Prymnesium_polylepis.1
MCKSRSRSEGNRAAAQRASDCAGRHLLHSKDDQRDLLCRRCTHRPCRKDRRRCDACADVREPSCVGRPRGWDGAGRSRFA